jgi:hypothetical protein
LLAQRGQAAVQAAAGGESEWVQLGCDFWASIDAAGRPAGGFPFRYLSYAQLVLRMRALAHVYPALAALRSVGDPAGRAPARECSEDLAGVRRAACRVWALELGARRADGALPQVFLSGAPPPSPLPPVLAGHVSSLLPY